MGIGILGEIIDPHDGPTILIGQGDRRRLTTQLPRTFAGHTTKLLIGTEQKVDDQPSSRPEQDEKPSPSDP